MKKIYILSIAYCCFFITISNRASDQQPRDVDPHRRDTQQLVTVAFQQQGQEQEASRHNRRLAATAQQQQEEAEGTHLDVSQRRKLELGKAITQITRRRSLAHSDTRQLEQQHLFAMSTSRKFSRSGNDDQDFFNDSTTNTPFLLPTNSSATATTSPAPPVIVFTEPEEQRQKTRQQPVEKRRPSTVVILPFSLVQNAVNQQAQGDRPLLMPHNTNTTEVQQQNRSLLEFRAFRPSQQQQQRHSKTSPMEEVE